MSNIQAERTSAAPPFPWVMEGYSRKSTHWNIFENHEQGSKTHAARSGPHKGHYQDHRHWPGQYVNGKTVHKRVTWERYCILDASYGGFICDNKLIHRLAPGDVWSVSRMDTDIAINGIDVNLLTGDVDALKKRTAKIF